MFDSNTKPHALILYCIHYQCVTNTFIALFEKIPSKNTPNFPLHPQIHHSISQIHPSINQISCSTSETTSSKCKYSQLTTITPRTQYIAYIPLTPNSSTPYSLVFNFQFLILNLTPPPYR